MKLSLCIICKDEELRIERCINSVKDYVDEIIIVDTGSTDKTIDVVSKLGAKVFEIEWENDFAKARNYAIEKSHGDWVIFLDADEYVLEEDRKYIRNYVIEAINRNREAILVEMLNIDNGNIQSIFKPVRLFKKDSNILYTGRIHEYVCRKDRQIKLIEFDEPLRILHDGYSREVQNAKDKIGRNLEMLLKEYELNPKNTDVCFYLMETYYEGRQIEEARKFGEKVLEYNNGTLIGIMEVTYSTLIQIYIDLNKPKKEIERLYNEAIQIDYEYPEFDYRYGYYLFNNGDYKNAIEYLDKSIYKVSVYKGLAKAKAMGNITNIYKILSNCYVYENRNQEAVQMFIRILRINKYEYNTLYNLISVVGKSESPEVLAEFLYKLYDIKEFKDQEILKLISKGVGNKELYTYIENSIVRSYA